MISNTHQGFEVAAMVVVFLPPSVFDQEHTRVLKVVVVVIAVVLLLLSSTYRVFQVVLVEVGGWW